MACYLINRSPTKALKDITPEKAWTGKKPDVSLLKVFGSQAFVHIPDKKRSKLDAKSIECILIGYSKNSKAYKCIDPKTNKIYVSRDVVFNEEDSIEFSQIRIIEEGEKGIEQEAVRHTENEGTHEDEQENKSEITSEEEAPEAEQENESEITSEEGPADPSSTSETSQVTEDSIEKEDSRRQKKLPKWYIKTIEEGKSNVIEQKTRGQRSKALLSKVEPQNFQEAKDRQEWKVAMDNEMNSIRKNQTWELVELPANKSVVSCKWVYKTKRGMDGKVEKYKARLVAKGYTQTAGVDFDETFSPVAKMNTVRTVIALAAAQNWKISQLDVKSAFLNGELEEEVYMQQPEGYTEKGQENLVCRLKKALYGLKQAPRAWYAKLDHFLEENKFNRCNSDSSLYIRKKNNKVTIIVVYVDDMLLTRNDEGGIKDIKDQLQQKFEMTDLGSLNYYLGLEAGQYQNYITLSQSNYIYIIYHKESELFTK